MSKRKGPDHVAIFLGVWIISFMLFIFLIGFYQMLKAHQ